jgi:hypothetical protein
MAGSKLISRMLGKTSINEARSIPISSEEVIRNVFIDKLEYDPDYDRADEGAGEAPVAVLSIVVMLSVDDTSPSSLDERYKIQEGWQEKLRRDVTYYLQQENDRPFKDFSEATVDKIVQVAESAVR